MEKLQRYDVYAEYEANIYTEKKDDGEFCKDEDVDRLESLIKDLEADKKAKEGLVWITREEMKKYDQQRVIDLESRLEKAVEWIKAQIFHDSVMIDGKQRDRNGIIEYLEQINRKDG